MKVLVWQWGRRGAGPRFAAQLAAAFDQVPGVSAVLSLSAGAELLAGRERRSARCRCGPMPTSPDWPGGCWLRRTGRGVGAAVPGDGAGWRGVRDAGSARSAVRGGVAPGRRSGDGLSCMMRRRIPGDGVSAADDVATATGPPCGCGGDAVFPRGGAARGRRLIGVRAKLIVADHPPFDFGPVPPAFGHGDRVRLLSFGRLLPYKGLDLLVEALKLLGPRPGLRVRVVGQGPESETLRALRALPGVTVENRWVAESEIASLLGWADAVVLPYREASQSGVAAAALAAGRMVICTRVGGLEGQLRDEPLARLCDPDAGSLAAAIREFVEAPVRVAAAAVDPARAWRGLAERLVGEAMAGARHDGFRQPGS